MVNTVSTHQKFRNVERDPRVTVLIVDRHDPFRYVEVRGRVVDTVTGPEARRHIDKVAQAYLPGIGGSNGPGGEKRAILRIAAHRQVVNDSRTWGADREVSA